MDMCSNSRLAFVVVTYNSRNLIGDCLMSILGQTPCPLEIIVVDNNSSDGTAEFVKSAFDGVTLHQNRHNTGYGAANNLGVSKTSNDFVAMVNPDVQLESNWSGEILRAFANRPECGAVEGKLLLEGRRDILNSRGSSLNILGFGCTTGYGERDIQEIEAKRVSYPSGAAFAVRRRAFVGIDGFDETYFLYHEDVDLGLRLHTSGWSVLYVPTAIAYHDFRSGLGPEKVRFLERNRWKTLAKNMPMQYFIKCGPLLILSELGIVILLSSVGLAKSKLSAVLDFLSEFSRILIYRRTFRDSRLERAALSQVLTDVFPTTVLSNGQTWVGALVRELQSGYYKAFFSTS